MKARKRLLVSFVAAVIFATAGLAQGIPSLLQMANESYAKGDLLTALSFVGKAKAQMEEQWFSSMSSSYVPLASWNPVKVSPAAYMGKKVKVTETLVSINNDGTLYLAEIGMDVRFDKKLADQISSLNSLEDYSWYGTVCKDSLGFPTLSVDYVEAKQ